MKCLLATVAGLALAATANAQVGQKANLDVTQWYNSPPISVDQLQGHTVLVEVFRTW
jgi:hypothetical protein